MNRSIRAIVFHILLVLPFFSRAQSGDTVFNDTILHEIRIQFPYAAWFDSLEADYQLNLLDVNDSLPEREFLCNLQFDNIDMDSIGMRERGNFSNFAAPLTSSNGLKKPFKLVFGAFRKQKFNGLKELNLNNGTDDPSFLREAIVYKLIRDRGIPACRTGYAKLFVNDVYWGLYELVENVDKTFLKDHYGAGNNTGNLYKTDRNAGVYLNWMGTDPAPYRKQGLVLKTNDSLNDWSRFTHFVDVLNHAETGNIENALGSVFDVESYLDILAVEVLCYSWDSYWGGGNNFYLYEHPDGKIHWIPWDFNETFSTKGGILGIVLPNESDIFLSTHFDKRPLLKAIFRVKKWQDMYLNKVCDICTNQFCTPQLSPVLRKWQEVARPGLVADTNALGSIQSFDNALTIDMDNAYNFTGSNAGFNVRVPALLPYITRQRSWAVNQIKKQDGTCALADATPAEYSMIVGPDPATDMINVFWDKLTDNVFQLVVYNSYGENVIRTGWIVNDGMQEKLNISTLPKGFYIVRKQDADGFWADAKFIKQ